MPIIKYRDPITKEMVELPIKFDPADGSIDITKFDPELQNILTSQIIRSYTEPEGIQEGRLWLDMNTTDFQGTAFNQLSSRITDLESRKLVTVETLNVGPGGEFNTINEALVYATTKYPTYVAGDVKAEVVINLKSGFVMAEQVIVKGLNLGWIRITGEDAETVIQRSALTQEFQPLTSKPAFGVMDGELPVIDQLFNMDVSGVVGTQSGIIVFRGTANISEGAGIKNVADKGLFVVCGKVYAQASDFSGAGINGIYAVQSSLVSASYSKVNNVGTGSTHRALYAVAGSTIEFTSGEAKDCSGIGILSYNSSNINAREAVAIGAGQYGVLASIGSKINFYNGNAQKGGTPSISDIKVDVGSTISANGATGGVSQTINTLTSAGIIFM